MPYLTPDASGDGSYICRRLRIPTEIIHIVTGALEKLTYAFGYELDGDLTPEQTAALAADVFTSYLESGDFCMIGTIAQYITDDPPAGVLSLDGTTYNDADYPLLAAVIDPAYDNGNGTFTLPDMRGRVLLAVGNGAGLTARAIGDTGGAETHQLTQSEMPSHNHTYSSAGLPDVPVLGPGEVPVNALSNPAVTGSTGADAAHENMPPFYAVKMGVWAE